VFGLPTARGRRSPDRDHLAPPTALHRAPTGTGMHPTIDAGTTPAGRALGPTVGVTSTPTVAPGRAHQPPPRRSTPPPKPHPPRSRRSAPVSPRATTRRAGVAGGTRPPEITPIEGGPGGSARAAVGWGRAAADWTRARRCAETRLIASHPSQRTSRARRRACSSRALAFGTASTWSAQSPGLSDERTGASRTRAPRAPGT